MSNKIKRNRPEHTKHRRGKGQFKRKHNHWADNWSGREPLEPARESTAGNVTESK